MFNACIILITSVFNTVWVGAVQLVCRVGSARFLGLQLARADPFGMGIIGDYSGV